jgi:hypothetical protein
MTSGLLTKLKHQVRDLAVQTLSSTDALRSSPEELRSRTVTLLQQSGGDLASPPYSPVWTPEDQALVSYGYIEALEFQRPISHSDLLAVRTRLAINCGSDTSLYLFRRSVKGYRLVLELENNDYSDVSGAQNWLEYAVSPPDRTGGFFVVAADVNAWCTSRWQTLRYKLLRLGDTPDSPRVILNAEHGVLRDREPPFHLSATASGFSLRFWHEQSLDLGIMDRRYVLTYEVNGDRASRIPPFAFRPEDFLDEWIHMPWSEASRWVPSNRRNELQPWHERFGGGNRACCGELESVRSCPDHPETWQISADGEYFFKVSKRHGEFYVEDIGKTEDKGCDGKNLLESDQSSELK